MQLDNILSSLRSLVSINLSFKLLPILALILGIAAIVAPRFLNVFVAIFLIAYALVGFGVLR
jgi:hypothetical protein